MPGNSEDVALPSMVRRYGVCGGRHGDTGMRVTSSKQEKQNECLEFWGAD